MDQDDNLQFLRQVRQDGGEGVRYEDYCRLPVAGLQCEPNFFLFLISLWQGYNVNRSFSYFSETATIF